MRRALLLAASLSVCLGLDLPETGPVPVDAPRPSEASEQTLPVPTGKPASGSPAVEDSAGPSGAAESPGSSEAGSTDAGEKASEAAAPKPPDITAPEDSETSLAQCEAELRKLGALFERQAPVTGEGGCGIGAPYAIEEIVPGVALSPTSHLRCETALALARWTADVVIPATRALPGEVKLTRLTHGSTYVCRRRNNRADGKMSEHAIGNAIDIAGFGFSGRPPLGVSPRAGNGNLDEAFQRAVRAGACLHFTTVLGPGADASHDDHLHLDIAERSRGYRLCQ